MAGEINKRIQQLKTELASKKLASEAYKFFVSRTPYATGNARNKTKLQGDEIQANYPYAAVLDKGRHLTNRGMRGSLQAPDGMSKPTDKFIRGYIRNKAKKG